MSEKHFNAGNVFGKVLEVKEDQSEGGKPYLQINVDVSGAKTGRVTAYLRMWGEKRCQEFMDEWRRHPGDMYWFRCFFGQYTAQKTGETHHNFTAYQWERKQAEKRAVFVLKGEVSHQPSSLNDGGQRFLMVVRREGTNGGQDQVENFELYAPGEKLLDPVSPGDLVEVKGLIRQREVDDFYGSSDGPIRAYVDLLKIIPRGDSAGGEDKPF